MIVLSKRNNQLGEGIAIWLQKPSHRTIYFDNNHKYFVSLPSTIFRVHYRDKYDGDNLFCKSLKVGFIAGVGKRKPTRKTPVFIPPFKNIIGKWDHVPKSDWLFTCMGGDEPVIADDVEGICKAAVTNFWSTRFNNDVEENGYSLYKNARIAPLNSYKAWAAKTKEDITWVPDRVLPCYSFEEFAHTDNYVEIAFSNDEDDDY